MRQTGSFGFHPAFALERMYSNEDPGSQAHAGMSRRGRNRVEAGRTVPSGAGTGTGIPDGVQGETKRKAG